MSGRPFLVALELIAWSVAIGSVLGGSVMRLVRARQAKPDEDAYAIGPHAVQKIGNVVHADFGGRRAHGR